MKPTRYTVSIIPGVPRVRYKHTKVNDELRNLEAGNPLLPPNADTTSRLEVVPVHDNMHHQINRDGNPRLKVAVVSSRKSENG